MIRLPQEVYLLTEVKENLFQPNILDFNLSL